MDGDGDGDGMGWGWGWCWKDGRLAEMRSMNAKFIHDIRHEALHCGTYIDPLMEMRMAFVETF